VEPNPEVTEAYKQAHELYKSRAEALFLK